MKAINNQERTAWSSEDGKFENFANSTRSKYIDSNPENPVKSWNHHSFVVEWQMTDKAEIPDVKSIPHSF